MLRKKEVDSVDRSRVRRQQLERKLSAFDLAAVGVGATVGAGVYILVGTVARDHAGPALPLSFLVAGLAAGLSAFCLFFLGEENMPSFLARHTILELGGVVIDPCAAIFVIIATVLIYFPFGMNGMFAGSAIVFFSYIGFDSVTSTAEEVMNPQRDFRLGIGTTISVCCILYMLVFAVIVGLVPYHALDPDTPISSAFSSYGVQWPVIYIPIVQMDFLVCSISKPRIMMAMARDGLSWSCFSDINEHTHVPVKGTAVSGICAAILAFFMDVSQLSGMVSTLLAFTSVAVSVLIIRYVPLNGVPLPLQDAQSLPSDGNIQESEIKISQDPFESSDDENQGLHEEEEASLLRSLIERDILQRNNNLVVQNKIRRQKTAWLDECHHHSCQVKIVGQESRELTLSTSVTYKATKEDCKLSTLPATYCTINSYYRKD
ncbi:hypothetical protein UlMin_006982 [Ulmus minor]